MGLAGYLRHGLESDNGKQAVADVAALKPFLDSVAGEIAGELSRFHPELLPYAEHVARTQGKFLRSQVLGVCAGVTGGITAIHVKAAAIVELIHLATLIHDDVMDGAGLRRGSPTMNAKWGVDTSILFGDCLFAHALRLACDCLPREAARAIAEAVFNVCTGEIIQHQHKGNYDLDPVEYHRAVQLKTGELFALACELAALLNNAPAEVRAALREFGLNFGTAYQIYDDCLDLVGDEDLTGKSLGSDLARDIPTLPILIFWRAASPEHRAQFKAVRQSPHQTRRPLLLSLLGTYRSIETAMDVVMDYLQRGIARAGIVPGIHPSLAKVTELLAERVADLRTMMTASTPGPCPIHL